MAYQSNLMGEFWRGQRQRRLATGTSLTQNEMGGLLNPILDTNARMAEAAARREQQQSQFNQTMDLRKDEVANQRLTGMVGGVTQAAMLPLAYGAGKSMGWWGTQPTTPNSGLLGTPTVPAMDTMGTGGQTLPNLMTAQGSVVPTVAGTTAQGATIGVPAAAGGVAPEATSLAAEQAGTGLLGTTGTVAGPAGLAGVAGGYLGQKVISPIVPFGGAKEKAATGGALGGAAAGALAGAAATSWSGPGAAVGAVIGGIIGGISSLF